MPPKFIKNTKDNLKLLNRLPVLIDTKNALVFLLSIYPLNENKIKVVSKLNPSQRLGFINRYVMGLASKNGYKQEYIKQFLEFKHDYSIYKSFSKNDASRYIWHKIDKLFIDMISFILNKDDGK